MTKRFTRKKEDFACEHCGERVMGDGYTNHCPACLWSKHVDVNPGDRAAECGGMMRAERWEIKNGEERIVHQCVSCGHEKVNRISKKDSREELVKIAQNKNF